MPEVIIQKKILTAMNYRIEELMIENKMLSKENEQLLIENHMLIELIQAVQDWIEKCILTEEGNEKKSKTNYELGEELMRNQELILENYRLKNEVSKVKGKSFQCQIVYEKE